MKNGKVYAAKVTLNKVFNIRVFQTSSNPTKYACLADVVEVIGEDKASLEFIFQDRETGKCLFPDKTLKGHQVIPIGFVLGYWLQMADHNNQVKDEGNNVALRLTRSLVEKGLEERADKALKEVKDRKRVDLHRTNNAG
ncbi:MULTISPECIES: hypothetical protein [Cyanophyceae]|uniref:hypothetical protein n=1 Tax=Cyanophyceae TaxID=3028117 RepID=UPI001687D57D|nr:hypothetical protein [Trichocoleus sp. FACHB-40]MBD2006881.1 hypothetical protein [Trichocoleus sp. FACHB-40]